MSPAGCVREVDVLRATRSGDWPIELRAHVAGCSACDDLTLVVHALADDRRERQEAGEMVDAQLVWRRAHLRARHVAVERALGPITVVEAVALVSATAAGVLVLARIWPVLETLISSPPVL